MHSYTQSRMDVFPSTLIHVFTSIARDCAHLALVAGGDSNFAALAPFLRPIRSSCLLVLSSVSVCLLQARFPFFLLLPNYSTPYNTFHFLLPFYIILLLQ
jgi:hypothetical protein